MNCLPSKPELKRLGYGRERPVLVGMGTSRRGVNQRQNSANPRFNLNSFFFSFAKPYTFRYKSAVTNGV